MTQTDQTDPVALEEPETTETAPEADEKNAIWMRLLHIVILGFGFWLAEMLMILFTILQFGWMLFAKEKNPRLATAGEAIGNWMRDVVRFFTGASEEKPFPFRDLG